MKKILTLLLISNSLFSQVKLPARIEAENYSSARLTTLNTDTAADNMGGKYVTFKTGAWSSFYVNVMAAGTYVINLRIADGSGGSINQIVKSDGTVWAKFTTAPTGGLNVWRTISCKIALTAGKQTFRLVDVFGEYNMDWLEIVPLIEADTAAKPNGNSPSIGQFNDLKTTVDKLTKTADSLRQQLDANVLKLDSKRFKKLKDGTITIQ